MGAKSGLDRDRVIEAAARLADSEGWESLSLARLAEVLKIRPPSLYNHIDGLAGLKRELALRALHLLAENLRDAAIGKSGDDAVRALAEAYRKFVKLHRGLYSSTLSVRADDSELSEASDRIVQTCIATLSAYGLSRRDAIHTVRGLRSAVHGFATLESAGGFGLPIDIDESFRRLIGIYLRGLKNPAK